MEEAGSRSSTPCDKINLIMVTYWLKGGGAEKQLLILARMVARLGYRCIVVAIRSASTPPQLEKLISDSIEANVQILIARKGLWAQLIHVISVLLFISRQPKCVVWSWGRKADLLAMVGTMISSNVIWLSSLRSADSISVRKWRVFQRLIDPLVSGYISNTTKNCDLLQEVLPNSASKCRVLRNAVASASPVMSPPKQTRPPPLLVAMLGNINPYIKGYDLVVNIAEQCKAEKVPIEFHIGGRDDSSGWLSRQIHQRNLEGLVFYEGEVSEPISFLAKFHLFLLTSRVEGMPNALLEAMSLGLPCIGTKVGDLETFFPEQSGLILLDVGNSSAIFRELKVAIERWDDTLMRGTLLKQFCERSFGFQTVEAELPVILNSFLCRSG